MASTQCDYPGCSEPVKLKCGGCGKVYCVLHIRRTGPIDTCDVCIARAITEKEEEATKRIAEIAETLAKLEADRPRREANRRKRTSLAWTGISMILSGVLLAVILLASYSPERMESVPLFIRVIMSVLFWGGIIALLAILRYRD